MSLKSRFLAFLGTTAVVLVGVVGLPATSAGAATNSPGWIEGWLYGGRVTVQNWDSPANVTLSVNGQQKATATLVPQPMFGPNRFGYEFQDVPGVFLQPGDVVTVADTVDVYVDSLTLTDVGFTSADFTTGTYTGWGTAGAWAHTCVNLQWQRYQPANPCQNFTVPGNGIWSVSYNGVLPPFTNSAYAESDAEGNVTAVGGIYGPWFSVMFPDAVEGEGWTPGGTVHVTVSDPAFETDVSVDPGGNFGLALNDGVSVGAHVTVSDGVSTKSTQVNVPQLSVDLEADLVTGEAPDGVDVVVVVPTGPAQRHVVSSGGFAADFANPGSDGDNGENTIADITANTTGKLAVYDEDFDFTASKWHAVPLTFTFTVNPTGTVNLVSGQATVTLTITASRDAFVVVDGQLSQKVGRKNIARGWFGDDVWVSTTPTTVPITIGPEYTPFGSGTAWLDAWLTVPDDIYAGASWNGPVQLKTLPVKKPHR